MLALGRLRSRAAGRHGAHYLTIVDDGRGMRGDPEGLPDFRYVATHICDSMKRRLKANGVAGIAGGVRDRFTEFLDGWGGTHSDFGGRGWPNLHDAHEAQRSELYGDRAAAAFPRLRHRAHRSPVTVRDPAVQRREDPMVPRLGVARADPAIGCRDPRSWIGQARKEFKVEPRQFTGRLLHGLPVPTTAFGQAYVEIYLSDPDPAKNVGLYRSGTRLIDDLA